MNNKKVTTDEVVAFMLGSVLTSFFWIVIQEIADTIIKLKLIS